MVLGKGFGFWKTMPIRRRTSTGSTSSAYRSWPRYTTPVNCGARDQVVHPVQAADQGALAAAGRADEGRDLAHWERIATSSRACFAVGRTQTFSSCTDGRHCGVDRYVRRRAGLAVTVSGFSVSVGR